MKKKKKKKQQAPSKLNTWIERKSEGKEKQYIIYMLVFSFLLMGTVITMRFLEEEPEPSNYDLNIKPKPIDLTEEAQTDLLKQYDDIQRDKKMVSLLEEYQMLIEQKPLDTLRIYEVQKQLRILKAYYEKN